jgi:hypothetical protein
MRLALGLVLASAAVAAVTFGGDTSPSSRDVLVREAVSLLPDGTRLLEASYRRPCHALFGRPAPPCLSMRLHLGGSVDARAGALLARAGDGWTVTDRRAGDVRLLELRHGDVRAHVTLRGPHDRASCEAHRLLRSCDDTLRIEVGPPLRLPRIRIHPGVTASVIDAMEGQARRRVEVIRQQTTTGP